MSFHACVEAKDMQLAPTTSWRTGRMARHKQECIRLPYTAALASQRAFFVKVLPPATKERNRERVSCFRFETGLVSSC